MDSRVNFLLVLVCASSVLYFVEADQIPEESWQSNYERIFKNEGLMDPEDTMDLLIKIDQELGRSVDEKSAAKLKQVRQLMKINQPLGNRCNMQDLIELDSLGDSLEGSSPVWQYFGHYKAEQIKLCHEIVINQFGIAEDILPESSMEKVRKLASGTLQESDKPGVELTDILTRDRLVQELIGYIERVLNPDYSKSSTLAADREVYAREFDEIIYLPCKSFFSVVEPYLQLAEILSEDESFKLSVADNVKAASICQAVCEARNSLLADTYKALHEKVTMGGSIKGKMEKMFKKVS